MDVLARCGFAVEALTGTVLELGQEFDPDAFASDYYRKALG